MNRRLLAAWNVSLWVALSVPLVAQQDAVAAPSAQDQPGESPFTRLPRWLKLGAEVRGRAESGNDFDETATENLYLNRVRLNVAVRPLPWIQFFFQGQDARAFSLGQDADEAALRNTLDVRQAYVNFGRGETGWQLRLGRQELAVGDERLVGADNYWDAFGQSFDAVQAGYIGKRFRVNAFTGFRVAPSRRRLDPSDTDNRISGLSVQVKTVGEGILEPYFLWKRGENTLDLVEHPGHRDVLTPGVRAQGDLPCRLDYNVEMALQRGHVVDESLSAWAGHWELGLKPLGKEFGLRIAFEYNYASGDSNLHDGKHGTFDDLYPAGFNKYGMEDPIAWRNIRYPAVGVEMPLNKRWTLYGGYRLFRLATFRDGLYPGGDECLVRNPSATSASVGSHALVSAGYTPQAHWKIFAGYGYLFPGAYLRESGFETRIRTAYIATSFAF